MLGLNALNLTRGEEVILAVSTVLAFYDINVSNFANVTASIDTTECKIALAHEHAKNMQTTIYKH